jgi:hypothetical protein
MWNYLSCIFNPHCPTFIPVVYFISFFLFIPVPLFHLSSILLPLPSPVLRYDSERSCVFILQVVQFRKHSCHLWQWVKTTLHGKGTRSILLIDPTSCNSINVWLHCAFPNPSHCTTDSWCRSPLRALGHNSQFVWPLESQSLYAVFPDEKNTFVHREILHISGLWKHLTSVMPFGSVTLNSTHHSTPVILYGCKTW